VTTALIVLAAIVLWALTLLAGFWLLAAWADWRHPLPELDDPEVEEHGRPHSTVHRLDDYRRDVA
jgi:hypothetical protein